MTVLSAILGPSNVLLTSDIGSSVQAYDADTAKLDVAQAWTKPQRAVTRTADDTNGEMAMGSYQDFQWTPGAADQLTFSGETIGYRGLIVLNNGSNYTITAGAEVEHDEDFLDLISDTGVYELHYWCYDGTNVLVTASQAMS